MATQKNSKSKATASKAKAKVAPVKKTTSKAKSAPGKPKPSAKTVQASKGKKAAPVFKAKFNVKPAAKAISKKPAPVKASSKVGKPVFAPKSKPSQAKPAVKKSNIKPATKQKPPIASKSPKPAPKAPVKMSKPVAKTITPLKVTTPISKKAITPVKADVKNKATEVKRPQPKALPVKQPAVVQSKPPFKATGSKITDAATRPSVSAKTMVEKPHSKPINIHTVKPFEKMSDKKENKPVSATAYAEEPQKTRYNDKELEEFDQLIDQKLIVAREQLEFYLKQLEDMAENPDNKIKGLDDGLSTLESERVSSMAARQQKLIQHLENAKIRIKNKVYGICRETGKLISKERLRAVPHATLSIEAKQAQN